MNLALTLVILLLHPPTEPVSLAMDPAYPASAAIVVEKTTKQPLSALPSQTVTMALKISAKMDGIYKVKANMPDRWNLLKAPDLIRIKNHQPYYYLIGFKVPETARAGHHYIQLQIQHAKRPELQTKSMIEVSVSSVFNVDIQTDPAPPYLIAGQKVKLNGMVYNRSNSALTFSLRPESRIGDLHITPAEYHLEAGEHQSFRITADLPEKLKHTERISIDIKTVVGDSIMTRTRLSSTVYPISDHTDSDYHVYPVESSLSTVWQDVDGDRSMPYQMDIQGGGKLFENRSPHLAFHMRAPGYFNHNTLMLPSRDLYQLTYHDEHLRINAGDQSFSTSRLSGNAFSGFGGGLGYQNNDWDSYIYYAKNRYSSMQNEKAGGRIYRHWNRNLVTGLNLGWNNGYQNGTLVSLDQIYRPVNKIFLQSELGVAETPYGTNMALYSRGKLEDDHLSLKADFLKADPYYPTIDKGVTTFGGSLQYNPKGKFKFTALYRDNSRDYYLFGMRRVGIAWNNFVRARWVRQVRKNDLLTSVEHNILDAAELKFTYHLPDWSISSTFEWGGIRYLNRNRSLPYHELTVQSTIHLWQSLSLNSGFRYTNGGMLFSYRRQSNISFQLGLNGMIAPRTSISMMAINYHYKQASLKSYTRQLRMILNYQLKNGHSLELRSELRDYGQLYNAAGIMLTYKLPFNLKLARSQDTGRLQGQLLNRQTGAGIAGIPILLDGIGTVTDDHGRFILSGRSPGNHNLSVIQTALDMNQLMEETMPMTVDIKPGEDTHVNLYAQESGSLKGIVLLKDDNGKTKAVENALVQLRDDQGAISRRLSMKDGSYQFRYLKPGTYSAELIPSYLPEEYQQEQTPQTVKIHYGSTTNLNFIVKPIERDIKMLTVENKPDEHIENEHIRFTNYTVKKNDWLSKIAIKFYNDYAQWPVIWQTNRDKIEDPDLIYPDTVLLIPLDVGEANNQTVSKEELKTDL